MDKKELVCVHTHTHTHTHEYYSATKKNEILLFGRMWIESITLSKIRKSEKGQVPCDFNYMWNLRNKKTSKGEKREMQTKKQTLNYREQNDGYQS